MRSPRVDGYWLITGLVRLLLKLCYRRIEIVGLDGIPARGPVVLAANHHNSHVDPMLLKATVPRRLTVLAKAPLFGHRRQEVGENPAGNEALSVGSLILTSFFAVAWQERLGHVGRDARGFFHFLVHRDLGRRLRSRRAALIEEVAALARLVPECVVAGPPTEG